MSEFKPVELGATPSRWKITGATALTEDVSAAIDESFAHHT